MHNSWFSPLNFRDLMTKFNHNLSPFHMKTGIRFVLSGILIILLSSCAATYNPIKPPTVKFASHSVDPNGLKLSYRYDVLRENRNKRYAKKEDKRGIRLVAVEITNQTDSNLTIGKDIVFYSGDDQVVPLESSVIQKTLRQSVPSYLPYLLLTFTTLTVTTPTTIENYRIGYVLGPVLTIGNVAVAASSNGKLANELEGYNLFDIEIPAGATVNGLIGIYSPGYNPLSVRIRPENPSP